MQGQSFLRNLLYTNICGFDNRASVGIKKIINKNGEDLLQYLFSILLFSVDNLNFAVRDLFQQFPGEFISAV